MGGIGGLRATQGVVGAACWMHGSLLDGAGERAAGRAGDLPDISGYLRANELKWLDEYCKMLCIAA